MVTLGEWLRPIMLLQDVMKSKWCLSYYVLCMIVIFLEKVI